jgi:hypothetical protein
MKRKDNLAKCVEADVYKLLNNNFIDADIYRLTDNIKKKRLLPHNGQQP